MQFGDRCVGAKNKKIVDLVSLKVDCVRCMQVTAIYR